MSQVFVMQPFEIIKVRLQTQTQEARLYNGIVDCFKQIVTKEGPLALFKGSATPLIGVGFLGAIRFGIYESFKKDIAYMRGTNGQPAVLNQADKTLAAFLTGIITSVGVVINH
jgi:solute carrier family 25 carnitine/acylcarnitine transporter 20/29